MAYRIVSSLDTPNAILGPLLGAPGIALGAVSFMPAVFGPGIRCDQGYVRFPTRAGGAELVSNSAGSISVWLKSLYPSGNPAGKQVVFSLYNDAGSNIIVFFDSDIDRFGFSEGEVGEVKEASARSFPFNAFFSLSLTWNGNWRRLYVNQTLACEQRQGAEFIPTYLALGGVEFGGRQLASWPSYSGVIDNLKAEDICRTSFADLNQQGVPTADSRPAFARTLLTSPRSVYLSAPADNQRNSLITGKGVAASRNCYMLTGSRDYRSAYAEVSLSSTRASYASAPTASVRFVSVLAVSPLSSERSASISAAAGALAERLCALFASSDAYAARSAAYTASATLREERAAALHALGGASVVREGSLTAKAAALLSRFASLSALPGTGDTRECRTTGAEGILEKRTVSSVGSAMAAAAQSLKTRPSFFRGLAVTDSSIAGATAGSLRALSPASALMRGASPLLSRRDILLEGGLPRSSRSCALNASRYAGTDWLSQALGWLEDAARRDSALSSLFTARSPLSSPSQWDALRTPRLSLIASRIAFDPPAGGLMRVRAELTIEAASPMTGGASALAARLLRAASAALVRRDPPCPARISSLACSRTTPAGAGIIRFSLMIEAHLTPELSYT